MLRSRLALSLILSLALILLQVPVQSIAASGPDVTGPVFSGLRVGSVSVPAEGVVTVSNTAWLQAGKSIRLTGTVKDPSGVRSLTLALTTPTNVTVAPVRLSVGYGGAFSYSTRLAAAGVWTATLVSTDGARNVTTTTVTIDIQPDTDGPTLALATLAGRTLPADGSVSLTPAAWASNKTPELRGRVTDPSGVQTLKLTTTAPDSSTVTANIVPSSSGYFSQKLGLKAPGVWSFELQAGDRAGNSTTRTLTVTVAEDTAGPDILGLKVNQTLVPEAGEVTISNDAWLKSGKKVQISGFIKDAATGLKVARVTLTAPETGESRTTTLPVGSSAAFASWHTLTAPGRWLVTLSADDQAGNTTTRTLTVEILPDTIGPVITFSSLGGSAIPSTNTVTLPTAKWLANKTPELRGRVVDPSGVQRLDIYTIAPDSTQSTEHVLPDNNGYFSVKLNLPTEGTWVYRFVAVDKGGNLSLPHLTLVVGEDRTGPDITLWLDGKEVAADSTVTVTNADWTAGGRKVGLTARVVDTGGLKTFTLDEMLPEGLTYRYTESLQGITVSRGIIINRTGTWTVTFTARDNRDNVTSAKVTVVVEP